MTKICPECGKAVPDESDFCYYCGCAKLIPAPTVNSGYAPPNAQNGNVCSSCGAQISQNDMFCQNCGTQITRQQLVIYKPKMQKYGWIGILLAIIPGFLTSMGFGLMGLGHLWFRKWTRAVVYILPSVFLIWYHYTYGGDLLMTLLWFMMFFMQTLECVALSFLPPPKKE